MTEQDEYANETCHALALTMHLGGLDNVPVEWRSIIGEPMDKWAHLALPSGPEPYESTREIISPQVITTTTHNNGWIINRAYVNGVKIAWDAVYAC